MSDLDQLYQALLLDHYKHPRNKGELPDATHHAEEENPLCGDSVTLHLRLSGGTIEAAGFEGKGCVLSMASASALTEAVPGHSGDEARALGAAFRRLVTGGDPDEDEPDLGSLAAFEGVKAFPTRCKCSLLPWRALESALGGDSGGCRD